MTAEELRDRIVAAAIAVVGADSTAESLRLVQGDLCEAVWAFEDLPPADDRPVDGVSE